MNTSRVKGFSITIGSINIKAIDWSKPHTSWDIKGDNYYWAEADRNGHPSAAERRKSVFAIVKSERIKHRSTNHIWMVFDYGGGTLDVAIISTFNNRLFLNRFRQDLSVSLKDRAIGNVLLLNGVRGQRTLVMLPI